MELRENFSRYVEESSLEVPEEKVQQELELLILEEKQRMQYETLTGVQMHLNPGRELQERMEQLRQEAARRAKEEAVLNQILTSREFPITQQELQEELLAIAARQNMPPEEVAAFFGGDMSLLTRDLRQRKAMAWACAQMGMQ